MALLWIAFALAQIHGLRDIPSLHRTPDYRPKKCRSKLSADRAVAKTPASIVIPCLNESWEHVAQTFLGILENSPHELVKEIILISDGGETYEEELQAMSEGKIKVRVVRHAKREGLIRAKNEGFRIVKGEIIIFYEPHVIAVAGWLEPLIAHIERNPNAVVMPALDVWTTKGDFLSSAPGYYRFEWNFNLMYTNSFNLGNQHADPYPTPATSGGIFGIRKSYFKELELYDEKLEEWGGDHIELAFKAWLCGGRIDMIPCSRVFHWFREANERPYDVDISKVVKNYVRLAEIWMDDSSLEAFYKVKPDGRGMDTGDITAAVAFKEKNCKSMDWYLKNIDWELGWEKSRICIPGGDRSFGGCELPAAKNRATIDRIIPQKVFHQRRKEAEGFYLDSAANGSGSDFASWSPYLWYVGVAALLALAYNLGKKTHVDTSEKKSKKKR